MPGPNGVEFICKLKNSSLTTRVIICTACYDNQLLSEARTLGVDKTIPKPADPAALMALIKNLAGQATGTE